MMKSMKPTVSLIDIATYLPENRVPADWYTSQSANADMRDNPMFSPPEYRHHSGIDESNVDMIERASSGLVAVTGPTCSPISTYCYAFPDA